MNDANTLRTLRRDNTRFTLVCEPEHMPVRGNVSASDDPALDKAHEDEILERLEGGDTWAWCAVEVRVTWEGYSASDYLGGCSYASEAEFTADGYYRDMCDTKHGIGS